MNIPAISVVIPSWDAAELLEKTLPSIIQQDGVHHEVIVIDNGSPTTATKLLVEKLASKYPHLRYHFMPNQAGYTGAVNEGVRIAKNSIIAILGNDNIAPRNWLSHASSFFLQNTANEKPIGAVMSQTIVSGKKPWGACTINYFGRNIFYSSPTWKTLAFETFYPGGNAFLFDKNIISQPFCTEYFAYHEDVSLGWRIQNLGMRVVQIPAPDIESFDGGSTKRKSIRFRSLFYTERNRWINLLTFPEKTTIRCLFPLWIVDSLASLCIGKHRRAKIYAWLWLIYHWRWIYKIRRERQQERSVCDHVAFITMSTKYFSIQDDEKKSPSVWIKKIINKSIHYYLKKMNLTAM